MTVNLAVTPSAMLKVPGLGDARSTWLAAAGATKLQVSLIVGGQQPGTPTASPVVGPVSFDVVAPGESDVPLSVCG